MTTKEVADLVAYLVALYPNQKISGPTVLAYQEALASLDAVHATQAVRDLRDTERFCPTVADIKRRYAELQLDAPPVSLAWEQFADKDAVKHELVKRAGRAMGGYYSYSASTSPDIFRAQFMKLYTDMLNEALARMARGGNAYLQVESGARLELEEGPPEVTGPPPAQVLAALEAGDIDFAKLTKDLNE